MSPSAGQAPGWPGIRPRWTSSAKMGVGTALAPASHVWFTLSHGILNEIYFPNVDQAATRDLGMIVTDGANFFSEEKRHAVSTVSCPAEGVPAYHLENTCKGGRYRIQKDILTDPRRDVLLQRTRFEPLQGAADTHHLFVLLAPHLGNHGAGNTAWVGDYKGVPMLFAERGKDALALACSHPWLKRSVGFVGVSDGWQDLARHRIMTWEYGRAENGNVALTAEVDWRSTPEPFLVVVGFGRTWAEAGNRVLSSLQEGFASSESAYRAGWRSWQEKLLPLENHGSAAPNLYRVSAAVIRTHEAKRTPGGLIASLSIPWGFAKGDDDLGGYHLVWPRDLVEAAGGLLAAGAAGDARRILHFLQSTQEGDGHWPQNMWLDGTPYWNGVQMDETAFPILLTDLALRKEALDPAEARRLWPMVRKAAGFLALNGPVTPQDRWEEDPGYSPFTLAVEIAGLLAAAGMAGTMGEPGLAAYLDETADAWNAGIERWVYVRGTGLARTVGVDGYYVRIAPPETAEGASPSETCYVPIKNRPAGESQAPIVLHVSPDALALVRFGLRSPHDPRILNTVKVIDALLKTRTPFGPAWHRYTGDGYGEHEDGSPFDGTGVGRLWPLLVGERAHYELAAGHPEEAARLLKIMERFANPGGMLPEQVWDGPEIPSRGLSPGKPSGSAMPLVWAHAEYIRLLRSLKDGRVFDMPVRTVRRYQEERRGSAISLWRFNHKRRRMDAGMVLRLEVAEAALIHWSRDGWSSVEETPTRDSGLGIHWADLPTAEMPPGSRVNFTFYWQDARRWEGRDFQILVEVPPDSPCVEQPEREAPG